MDGTMSVFTRLLGLLLIGLLATACSGTKMVNSWSSKDHNRQIKSVYIIGIAKNEFNRMLFEDTLGSRLESEGIRVVSSYTDLPKNKEADRETIIEKMKANACDSVLLTRRVDQRTVASISSGRRGSSAPYWKRYFANFYGDDNLGNDQPAYYSHWSSYYTNSYSVAHKQSTVTNFIVLTFESVLYDLQTKELIWLAQLETDLEGDFKEMTQQYVDEVVKNLKRKGLI
jgi:hypothetical protein